MKSLKPFTPECLEILKRNKLLFPLIKSEWIESGNNKKFFLELLGISDGIWSCTFSRPEGSKFSLYS